MKSIKRCITYFCHIILISQPITIPKTTMLPSASKTLNIGISRFCQSAGPQLKQRQNKVYKDRDSDSVGLGRLGFIF